MSDFISLFLYVFLTEDATSFDVIKAGHITKLLDEDLSADLDSLHVQKAISAISELLENLKSYGEDITSDKHKVKLFLSFWLRSLKRFGTVNFGG